MRLAGMAAIALLSCTRPVSDAGPARSVTDPVEGRPAILVRTCESSVYGDLGRGWREREISSGPVSFVGASGYADDPARVLSAPGDRATVQKVLIVVRRDRPAEISVRHPDAALFYDPTRWRDRNVVPFILGDPRVRFEPCGGDQRETQFNGGFLVRGPGCVPVEVRVDGGTPRFAVLSFGAGDCG